MRKRPQRCSNRYGPHRQTEVEVASDSLKATVASEPRAAADQPGGRLLVVGRARDRARTWSPRRCCNRAVAGPLRETTGVLASSAAEILAATTQQASGASESSAAVTQTVATVDEVAQTAEQATQRAKAVADTARRAAEIGEAGGGPSRSRAPRSGVLQEQVELRRREHPGAGRAGAGDRRDHRHGQRHRRADQPARAQRRRRGGARGRARPGLRRRRRRGEEPGRPGEEGDRPGAPDPGRDPAGHERRGDDHRAGHEAGRR